MKGAAAGGLLLGFPGLTVQYEAVAAPAPSPLLGPVAGACARLADQGWHTLLPRKPPQKPVWRTTATTATFPEAVRENEEVVPVNVLTWVLPSGVTVGR
ncbi:hypothetical protein ABZ471_20930 [Streptomyces sp. NPDC005728]|uniref:hypothetical protein n=1 Tax=Streptomyces sp. NPDC005728 TaxID=3157054 RepID=UPI0033C33916